MYRTHTHISGTPLYLAGLTPPMRLADALRGFLDHLAGRRAPADVVIEHLRWSRAASLVQSRVRLRLRARRLVTGGFGSGGFGGGGFGGGGFGTDSHGSPAYSPAESPAQSFGGNPRPPSVGVAVGADRGARFVANGRGDSAHEGEARSPDLVGVVVGADGRASFVAGPPPPMASYSHRPEEQHASDGERQLGERLRLGWVSSPLEGESTADHRRWLESWRGCDAHLQQAATELLT